MSIIAIWLCPTLTLRLRRRRLLRLRSSIRRLTPWRRTTGLPTPVTPRTLIRILRSISQLLAKEPRLLAVTVDGERLD